MSNKSLRDLATIQRWMQSVITHPSGIEAGIKSAEARHEIPVGPDDIESVIERSRARTSVQRLEVYGNAYFARLMDCMRDFFPATADALGEELFHQFAFEYLHHYPSHSYTLGRLPDRFVFFLEESRNEFDKRSSDANINASTWSDFVIDLARLEWTIEQIFDGVGVENESLLTTEQLTRIGHACWPDARLVPVVCLRLLKSSFPVNDYFTAFRKQQKPRLPSAQSSFMALSRRDYVVRRFPLSETQFVLLSALIAGERVGTALEQAAETAPDVQELIRELQGWFQLWASEGFFQRVELAEEENSR